MHTCSTAPGKLSFLQLGALGAQVPFTLPGCNDMYACFSCLEFLYLVSRTAASGRGWVVVVVCRAMKITIKRNLDAPPPSPYRKASPDQQTYHHLCVEITLHSTNVVSRQQSMARQQRERTRSKMPPSMTTQCRVNIRAMCKARPFFELPTWG